LKFHELRPLELQLQFAKEFRQMWRIATILHNPARLNNAKKVAALKEL